MPVLPSCSQSSGQLQDFKSSISRAALVSRVCWLVKSWCRLTSFNACSMANRLFVAASGYCGTIVPQGKPCRIHQFKVEIKDSPERIVASNLAIRATAFCNSRSWKLGSDSPGSFISGSGGEVGVSPVSPGQPSTRYSFVIRRFRSLSQFNLVINSPAEGGLVTTRVKARRFIRLTTHCMSIQKNVKINPHAV